VCVFKFRTQVRSQSASSDSTSSFGTNSTQHDHRRSTSGGGGGGSSTGSSSTSGGGRGAHGRSGLRTRQSSGELSPPTTGGVGWARYQAWQAANSEEAGKFKKWLHARGPHNHNHRSRSNPRGNRFPVQWELGVCARVYGWVFDGWVGVRMRARVCVCSFISLSLSLFFSR